MLGPGVALSTGQAAPKSPLSRDDGPGCLGPGRRMGLSLEAFQRAGVQACAGPAACPEGHSLQSLASSPTHAEGGISGFSFQAAGRWVLLLRDGG